MARRCRSPATETGAVIAEEGVSSLGQQPHEGVGPGTLQGIGHRRFGGVGSGQAQVAKHRVVEQVRVLRHQRHPLEVTTWVEGSERDAGDEHFAALQFEETQQQVHERAFPEPLGPARAV
jgi:hypothetical protein